MTTHGQSSRNGPGAGQRCPPRAVGPASSLRGRTRSIRSAREVVEELVAEVGGRVGLGEVAVDGGDVAHRDIVVAEARAVAAVGELGLLAERDLAGDLADEALVEGGADARGAAAGVHRVDVLAARGEVVADFLARARQADLVGALGDAEAAGGGLVGELEDVADDEGGTLAGGEAVDDGGHAALLELPEQEVALRVAERADDVGARGLAAQGFVEDVEVDLGLARQALLEDLVPYTEQPDFDVGVGRLVGLLGGLGVDVDDVALAAIAIEGEAEDEVVETAPVWLDQGT